MLRIRCASGTPTPLFDTDVGLGENRYAATHDGKRFLLNVGYRIKLVPQTLVGVLNGPKHRP